MVPNSVDKTAWPANKHSSIMPSLLSESFAFPTSLKQKVNFFNTQRHTTVHAKVLKWIKYIQILLMCVWGCPPSSSACWVVMVVVLLTQVSRHVLKNLICFDTGRILVWRISWGSGREAHGHATSMPPRVSAEPSSQHNHFPPHNVAASWVAFYKYDLHM